MTEPAGSPTLAGLTPTSLPASSPVGVAGSNGGSAAGGAATPLAPEATPEQLDELARQVEAAVFGGGAASAGSGAEPKVTGVASAGPATPVVPLVNTTANLPPTSPLPTPPITSTPLPPDAPLGQSVDDLVAGTPNNAAATTVTAEPIAATPISPAPVTPVIPPVSQTYTTIVDVLIEQKLITTEQADELRRDFLVSGRSFEDLVAEKQWLTEEQLTQAKATFNHVPFISIAETGISPEALGFLDETVARRYGVLPFAIDKAERMLSVAMKNPLDLQAVDFVSQKTGYHLATYYASPAVIDRIITERYAQSLSMEVNEALKDTNQTKVRNQAQQDSLVNFNGVIRDAPINRIVETILEFAVKARASDIHIEPLTGKVRVRYRIDGILVEKLILPKLVLDAVVSRIKILSNLKIDEKRMPQDGRFNYMAGNQEVDLRVSTLPTVNGEKVNLRLLEKNAAVPTLEELGLSGLALSQVKEAIKVPHGIILVSGPTGSGKTTTLYAVLHLINTPKVNILTLEDPVEYQMPGINQVQINPKAGLTFASGLRSFLRQDPNVIMIGEMRDSETTELAIQASLTGHLVFSTIHTSSAAGTMPRMVDMGAEPFLIASSMTLVAAQRIVRLINPDFKEEYTPEPVVIEDIKKVLGSHFETWCKQAGKDPADIKLYRPAANRPESEPDYKGRIGIFEVMRMTDRMGKLIMEGRPASEIEAEAVKAGMLLMKQDGYIKVLEGKTTMDEVLRVAEV